jgi:hypothetical protein
MTLIALRIFFGAAFLFVCGEAVANAREAPMTGDLRNAYYLVLCVILGLANGAVWAPYFGAKLSEPFTNLFTQDSSADGRNPIQGLLFRLQDRGHRRLTVLCALLEGWHHPVRPTAFLVGLRNARPGTWSEAYFARKVFEFDNAQHCLEAFNVLRKYGIDPRPHRNPEVNTVLMAHERQVKPDPTRLPVFPAPAPGPLKRDPRIKLATSPPDTPPPAPSAAAAFLPRNDETPPNSQVSG